MIQILIADDHALLRQGLQALLEAEAGWRVCGEAADGREAVLLAGRLRPDVAILDHLMPELDGLEATRRIRLASPRSAVLVLAGESSGRLVEEAAAAGARGFVLKGVSADQVILAVDALARGGRFFPHQGPAAGPRPAPPAQRAHAPPVALTSRELEITQLLAEGKTNWCVATILGISVRTVETHRANVMQKLGLQSVVELVHYAVRHRLVDPLPAHGAADDPPGRSAGGEG